MEQGARTYTNSKTRYELRKELTLGYSHTSPTLGVCKTSSVWSSSDEDINYNTRTSTSAAPEAFQAPPTPPGAPPLQAQALSPTLGPITRGRARELNYIMLLKNEGPEE